MGWQKRPLQKSHSGLIYLRNSFSISHLFTEGGGGVSKCTTFPISHSWLSVELLTLEQWVAVRKVRNQVACQIIIINMVVFSTESFLPPTIYKTTESRPSIRRFYWHYDTSLALKPDTLHTYTIQFLKIWMDARVVWFVLKNTLSLVSDGATRVAKQK